MLKSLDGKTSKVKISQDQLSCPAGPSRTYPETLRPTLDAGHVGDVLVDC